MENQHRKIKTYRELEQYEIDLINEAKTLEEAVAKFYWHLVGSDDIDKRQLALARTHIEQGFMHLVKSVARPETPWL